MAKKSKKKIPSKKALSKKVSVKKASSRKVPSKKVLSKKASVKKASSRKVPSKKVLSKKASVKKASSRKVPSKKVLSKKASVKKASSRKVPSKKVLSKKASVKKASSRKVSSKKVLSKKASVKKASSRKVPSKKVSSKKAPLKKSTKKSPLKKVAKAKRGFSKKKLANKKKITKKAVVAKKVSKTKKISSIPKIESIKKVTQNTTSNIQPQIKKTENEKKRVSIFQKIILPKIKLPRLKSKNAIDYKPQFSKSILKNDVHPIKSERYSDEDLQEFKEIILRKLEDSKKDLLYLQNALSKKSDLGEVNELQIMTPEEGSLNMEIDHLAQMASRTKKFINNLENALIRIENKTYGICRETGKLIEKERLKVVPHATLSIEAKNKRNQNNN